MPILVKADDLKRKIKLWENIQSSYSHGFLWIHTLTHRETTQI